MDAVTPGGLRAPPSLWKRLTSALAGPRVQMPRTRPFSEMGVSGTPTWGGYVAVREKSSQWVGQQRWITAADMAVNTPIIAAGIWHVTNLLAHPAWSFNPPDDTPQARELADFAQAAIFEDLATPWPQVVRRAAMYLYNGFGVQEWTAVRRGDGRVGFRDVEPRPAHTIERWDVADDGSILGVLQRSPQTGAELAIPRAKIMYLVEDTLSDSPEGTGILRMLAESWERLKKFHFLETVAFERDLRGIPVGRVPYAAIRQAVQSGDLTQNDADTLTKSMENFVSLVAKQTDTSITIESQPYLSEAADGTKVSSSPMWDLSLIQGSSNGVEALGKAITRTQLEMARLLMAEHLMMGESSGNRALSEDKSRNLYLVANAVLGNLAAAVDRDLLGPLWTLNNFPDELRPRAVPEEVSFKDAAQVALVLKDLAAAGAVLSPSDPVVGDVRDLMGVSPPEEVSPELMGLPAPGGPGGETDEEAGEDIDEEAEEGGAGGPVQKRDERTLFVKRRLVNADEVREWARRQGLPSTLPPGDMHVTVAFSREPVDWSQLQPDPEPLAVLGSTRSVHQFPACTTDNGAVVLRFEHPGLARRWQEFRDAGASWDFDDYRPHVTLTYAVEDLGELPDLEPYDGPLNFGPEEFAPIREDWANDIVEVPLRKKSIPRRRLRRSEADESRGGDEGREARAGEHPLVVNVAVDGRRGKTVKRGKFKRRPDGHVDFEVTEDDAES